MAYRVTAARLDRDQLQREGILEAALLRVSEGGFAALTMQELAQDAGMATGSLYRHFRGKGELVAAVFARASQHEVEALAELLRGAGSPAQRLVRGIAGFAGRAWHSRQLAYALIAEPVEPEVDEQRLRFREAYAALFAELLQAGEASGEFLPAPSPLVAACLVGAIAEALVGPLSPSMQAARATGCANTALDELIHTLARFCLGAVGVPADRVPALLSSVQQETLT